MPGAPSSRLKPICARASLRLFAPFARPRRSRCRARRVHVAGGPAIARSATLVHIRAADNILAATHREACERCRSRPVRWPWAPSLPCKAALLRCFRTRDFGMWRLLDRTLRFVAGCAQIGHARLCLNGHGAFLPTASLSSRSCGCLFLPLLIAQPQERIENAAWFIKQSVKGEPFVKRSALGKRFVVAPVSARNLHVRDCVLRAALFGVRCDWRAMPMHSVSWPFDGRSVMRQEPVTNLTC